MAGQGDSKLCVQIIGLGMRQRLLGLESHTSHLGFLSVFLWGGPFSVNKSWLELS